LDCIEISGAEIDDYVPYWFWNKLQSMSEMNISHNNLKGTIPNLQLKLPILKSNDGGIPVFYHKLTHWIFLKPIQTHSCVEEMQPKSCTF